MHVRAWTGWALAPDHVSGRAGARAWVIGRELTPWNTAPTFRSNRWPASGGAAERGRRRCSPCGGMNARAHRRRRGLAAPAVLARAPAGPPESALASRTTRGIRIVIGAPNAGPRGCGAAYDFARAGTVWREKAKIAGPGCASSDAFGLAVAMSGRTAIIGSPGKNNSAGTVYELTVP